MDNPICRTSYIVTLPQTLTNKRGSVYQSHSKMRSVDMRVAKFAFCILLLCVVDAFHMPSQLPKAMKLFGESCDDSATLGMDADSYQWTVDRTDPIEYLYKEWWFFYLIDEKSDVAAVFSYNIDDPQKSLNKQSSGLAVMIWPHFSTGNTTMETVNVIEMFPYEAFSGNKQNASVSVGPNNVLTVIDENTYHAIGLSKDSNVQWDLTFERFVTEAREEQNVALQQVDWMSWMPGAHVNGYIRSGDDTFKVEGGKGYHDHNWGAWADALFNWVWADYSDPSQRFAIVIGAYKIPLTSDYVGYVFVRHGDSRYKIGTFCGDSFALTPIATDVDPATGKKYVTHVNITAQSSKSDGNYRIEIDYSRVRSSPNPAGAGLGLDVFEMISQYNVKFFNPDGTLLVQSSGLGLNEWCDLKDI